MKPSRFARFALLLGLAAPACGSEAPATGDLPLDAIRLPKGYSISLFARDVPGARSLAWSPERVLYVGTRGSRVYAIPDRDGNYLADTVWVVADDLNTPNGVAWREGSLYVAEISRVLRYDDVDAHLPDLGTPTVIHDDLPRDGHHGWKFIAFGPDGKLYVPVGAPCNICDREDPRYAAILRMDADGQNLEVFARGIRNTVGFDWHPVTGELWFTDNGRDWLGDDAPPDELNRAPEIGLHFGFPYCHGGLIEDPEFGRGHDCAEFIPPVQRLGAHVAALGMRFYTGAMFPQADRGQVFIPEHGSWNRSTPIGYRITRVTLKGNTAVEYAPFAEGWLRNGSVWGRPVAILVAPDGSLFVSDDHAGAVYRITYRDSP